MRDDIILGFLCCNVNKFSFPLFNMKYAVSLSSKIFHEIMHDFQHINILQLSALFKLNSHHWLKAFGSIIETGSKVN